MRRSISVQLSIPQPCSQNWEAMSVNETGRFCDNCNKPVIDFTNYSDQQLADFFKRSKGTICGKLRNDQLEKELYPSQYSQNRSFPQLLVSAALAIGLGNNAYANDEHIAPTAIHVVASAEKEVEKSNAVTGGDSTRFVSGNNTVTKLTGKAGGISYRRPTVWQRLKWLFRNY
jgi:hypothetical protein